MITHFKNISERKIIRWTALAAFFLGAYGMFQQPGRGLFAETAITDPDIESVEQDPIDPNFHIVRTKDNQRFRIPKDMTLKKQGNVYLVETMDSYVFKRSAETKENMRSVEERLDRIEAVLGLEPLEEDTGKEGPK